MNLEHGNQVEVTDKAWLTFKAGPGRGEGDDHSADLGQSGAGPVPAVRDEEPLRAGKAMIIAGSGVAASLLSSTEGIRGGAGMGVDAGLGGRVVRSGTPAR